MAGLRRFATPALIGAASVCLLIGTISLYIDRELFNAKAFAGRAAAALENPGVRAVVATGVTDAVLKVEPDAVAFRPVISGVVDGVIGTPAFQGVFRGAVYDLHRTIFGRSSSTVTLALADVGVLVTNALDSIDPGLAAKVPPDLKAALVKISGEDSLGVPIEIARIGSDTRWTAIAGLVLALLLYAGAIAAARAGYHRKALGWCGVAIAAVGGLIFLCLELTILLGPRAADQETAGAVRGILGAFLGDLAVWSLALAAAGAIAAGAASALIRPLDLSDTFDRIRVLATATPATRWRRGVRALALIGLGIAALVLRHVLLDLIALSLGLGLLYVGVAELLRLWLPAQPPPPAEVPLAPPVRRRRGAQVVRAVAVGGLMTALMGAVIGLAVASSRPKPALVDVTKCNGGAALCGLRLDEVTIPGTHNSMAAADEPGWLFAGQGRGIPAQLEDGIRGLLIDTHYGFQTPRGVATDLDNDPKSRAKLTDEFGDQFVETAERLRGRIGFTGDAEREVFLCHGFCELGATKAVSALSKIHDFLVQNPGEVLVMSIEDGVSAADTAAVFEKSGLIDDVYKGPLDPMPTLGEMVESGGRVLVMGETTDGSVPWLHPQYQGLVQETPYDFKTPAALADPASCEPNRGLVGSPLFLMNNWVDTTPAPRPTLADQANARGALSERVDRCESERRRPVNLLAVDFYERGDLLGVVREMNAEEAQNIGSPP